MTSDESVPDPIGTPAFADLLASLRGVLAQQGWLDLVAELPDPSDEEPVRVAFVGPYNAGKSSLIAALTGDLSIRRSGKPESAVASRHPWHDNAELVDLPGWFSGFTDHDDRAEEDLRRNADLVAFVLTVELGDELVVDALEYVLGTLGFADRAVVVVNKAQTEDSDHDIVREEINRRLGRFVGVPVIPTDAQSLLDTISGEFDLDEESIRILADGSGINGLSESLNAMVSRHRQTARIQAQSLQTARVAAEAIERLVPNSEEEHAIVSLDEFESILARARKRLSEIASSHLTQLEAGIAAIADRVLEPGGLTEADHEKAWTTARKPVANLASDADRLLDELAADLDVVVSALRLAAEISMTPPPAPTAPSGVSNSKPLAPRLVSAMGLNAKGTSEVIAKVGEKVARDGARQGSVAYEWARKLQPKKKFAPYGRLNDAAKIQKGAKVASKASFAVPVIEEAWKWWNELSQNRKAAKAISEVRKRYAEAALNERQRVQADFDRWASDKLDPFDQRLALGRAPLEEVASAREVTRRQVAALRDAVVRSGDQISDVSQ
jgi:GTPase SAR1 family protein